MSSKINLQTCEYACKSSVFQDNQLILYTKICIKDEEKMRLNDVFKAFEQRGVFLDELSKEQVMKYYEKLNLIEKKSDSGDAQYVKRIL